MFLSHLLSSFSDIVEIGEDEFYAYSDVWTEYANNLLTQVFFWFAIALTAILIGIGIIVKLKKPENFANFIRCAAGIAGGYIITVIVSMTAIGYAKISEKGYAEYSGILNFVLIPETVLGGLAVLGIAATYISSLFSKKTLKITLITSASVLGAALIAMIVCLAVYFASGDAEANNGATVTVSESAALCISSAVLVLGIGALSFFFGKKDKKEYDTKSISYAAVCIAASFALSFIKFWQMPQGGSITLVSLLPLMLYSYMFGVRKGVLAGTVYGMLQAIQDLWPIHPAQFLLDYPIAFAAIGLAGMFAKTAKLEKLPQIKFALGAIAASVLRFISHVLAGVFAFSEYSTLDNVWLYSLGYNSFVFADIAITVAAGVIILSVKSFADLVKRIQTAASLQPNTDKTEESEENNSLS